MSPDLHGCAVLDAEGRALAASGDPESWAGAGAALLAAADAAGGRPGSRLRGSTTRVGAAPPTRRRRKPDASSSSPPRAWWTWPNDRRGAALTAEGAAPLIEAALARRVLQGALQHGGDFAEVFCEERSGLGLAIDQSRVEGVQRGSDRGGGVRVVRGETTYFAHVDGLGESELERA